MRLQNKRYGMPVILHIAADMFLDDPVEAGTFCL